MDPFIGEIRPLPFTFAPLGWLYCDGSLVSIADYQALYTLLGLTYGGDGVSTFGLPDLRSRVPMHASGTAQLGVPGGAEAVRLLGNQVPIHSHALVTGGTGTVASPVGAYPATASVPLYGPASGTLGPLAIGPNPGTGAPHDNVQPYLTLAFCIAYDGIYPSQN